MVVKIWFYPLELMPIILLKINRIIIVADIKREIIREDRTSKVVNQLSDSVDWSYKDKLGFSIYIRKKSFILKAQR